MEPETFLTPHGYGPSNWRVFINSSVFDVKTTVQSSQTHSKTSSPSQLIVSNAASPLWQQIYCSTAEAPAEERTLSFNKS